MSEWIERVERTLGSRLLSREGMRLALANDYPVLHEDGDDVYIRVAISADSIVCVSWVDGRARIRPAVVEVRYRKTRTAREIVDDLAESCNEASADAPVGLEFVYSKIIEADRECSHTLYVYRSKDDLADIVGVVSCSVGHYDNYPCPLKIVDVEIDDSVHYKVVEG